MDMLTAGVYLFAYLFCSIFILLSREATVALYFRRIHTRSELSIFQVIRLFDFFDACSKPPSRDNHRKVPYPTTQQRVR